MFDHVFIHLQKEGLYLLSLWFSLLQPTWCWTVSIIIYYAFLYFFTFLITLSKPIAYYAVIDVSSPSSDHSKVSLIPSECESFIDFEPPRRF